MPEQLNISFPKYSFDMGKAKEAMLFAEIKKYQDEIKNLKNTIRTYKGHFTKKQQRDAKTKNNNVSIPIDGNII